jgi:phosphoenolpyruvate phosphomutase
MSDPNPDYLRSALRDRSRSRPLHAFGAVNAVAAAIAQQYGADALWISGLEVSASLGLPDDNVLGPRDLGDVVTSARRVSTLPVIVDVDNGAGSLPTTVRLAQDLSRAGATAVCLEDSAYPKHNSFRTDVGQGLADLRMVAAQIDAIRQHCPELVVIARTEAMIAGADVAVALDRAHAFSACGADAVLMHSRDASGKEVLDAAARWDEPTPLVAIPTSYPQLSSTELGRAGYAMCIYANQLTRAAITAMHRVMRGFAEAATFIRDGQPALASVGELLRIADPTAVSSV